MEERVAWAQIDKPCLAVCLIVLVSETEGCENFLNFLPNMVVSLYCDIFWRVMKCILVVFGIFCDLFKHERNAVSLFSQNAGREMFSMPLKLVQVIEDSKYCCCSYAVSLFGEKKRR